MCYQHSKHCKRTSTDSFIFFLSSSFILSFVFILSFFFPLYSFFFISSSKPFSFFLYFLLPSFISEEWTLKLRCGSVWLTYRVFRNQHNVQNQLQDTYGSSILPPHCSNSRGIMGCLIGIPVHTRNKVLFVYLIGAIWFHLFNIWSVCS